MDRNQPALLEPADPAAMGLRPDRLDRLCSIIETHIEEKRYPGAQVAVARHGKLVLARSFGQARTGKPADNATLWRLYSNTKVLVAAATWLLVEDGLLTFQDCIAEHVPEFAQNGKSEITLLQVLTHQGGFPSALGNLPREAWEDHVLLRKHVCELSLEWTPGSRLQYHQRSAHWVVAVLIEAITGMDYRKFLRTRLLEPLGLDRELYVGLPESEGARAADVHLPSADGKSHSIDAVENVQAYRAAGAPGGGGYGTALGMATFYQMMLAGGRLNGTQLFSPRLISYVTRNYTGERVDTHMKMPMHRGLGPHTRGLTESIRGLGSLASPATYGHGGVGSSYCWADPESGVSFAYLSNSKLPDPWHSRRLDILSNCVHAAIGEA
jgi:CubicO group peptidase (beta-lactamase class C family)